MPLRQARVGIHSTLGFYSFMMSLVVPNVDIQNPVLGLDLPKRPAKTGASIQMATLLWGRFCSHTPL